ADCHFIACQWSRHPCRSRGNAGDVAQAFDKPGIESYLFLVAVASIRQIDVEREQALGAESEISCREAREGSSQDAGAAQQYEAQRDLHGHQCAAEAVPIVSCSTSPFFHRSTEIKPGEPEGRGSAEEQA